MNDLIRQIAVLSVLWTVCELFLPDGKQHQLVRVTASLLIMTALLTTIRGWLGQPLHEPTVMTIRVQQAAEENYQRTALTAIANQLESWCVKLARRAGYQARAAVWLALDGGLDHVDILLKPSAAAILQPAELRHAIAQQLEVEESCILLAVEEE